MESKKITLITLSIFSVFAFIYAAYALTNKEEKKYFEETITTKSTENTKWSPDKKIILTEYSDFECPACAYYSDIINEFSKNQENAEIIKKVTFVYRHFPLDQIHKNARIAAYYAEAAAKQGKFFEFHDLLFKNQAIWSKSSNPDSEFEKYATSLKLDLEKFQTDSKLEDIKNKVQSDYLSGTAAEVNGTPSFYLNGKKISFQTATELATILKNEINTDNK